MTNRPKIAVIDDEPTICDSLKTLLQILGYRCSTFCSAEDFLRAAPLCDAACLIFDVHLGSTTGLALARHPRVAELKRPIILMSASLDEHMHAQAESLGCAAVLSKPFTSGELLEALGKALDRMFR